MNFSFYMPARVYFGENCIRENREALKGLGQKALVVTGRHAAKAVGALDDVAAALEANGQAYVLFDQVTPNPTMDLVYRGAEIARQEACDFVICIGGGSPMDSGKAIALLAGEDLPPERLFTGPYTGQVLPIAAVPTTAGTGSEVTKASIITNDAAKTKSSINYEGIFAAVSFCDGRYTQSLKHATTMDTVVDALSHAVEGFLNVHASPLTDLLAGESIRRICAALPAAAADTLTLKDRENLLYASTLAGMVIANTGTTAVHAMGYELTYFKETPHGRANGYLLPALFRFYEEKQEKKLKQCLSYLGMETTEEFQVQMEQLLGRPEYRLTAEEIRTYAEIAIQAGNIKNCSTTPNKGDLVRMYTRALG